MDPISHVLTGALAAKTVNATGRRFWLMTLLSEMPDADAIFMHAGPWATWLQHRGLSHSLVGVPVQALLWAFLLMRFDRGPFFRRALFYVVPFLVHVLGDYLTSYGAPLLAPWTFHGYQLSLTPSVNFVPILFLSLGLMWTHWAPAWRRKIVIFLWMGWAVYLGFLGAAKARAFHLVGEAGAQMIPSFMNPFEWHSVTEDTDQSAYVCKSVDVLRGSVKPLVVVPSAVGDTLVVRSKEDPLVARFLENDRWPVARVVGSAEEPVVEWGTLLFSARGDVRGKVRVTFNADQIPQPAKRIFTFWNAGETSEQRGRPPLVMFN